MSEDAPIELPKSNAEDVANRWVARSIDLTGEGLVQLLRELADRAEQIRTAHDRATAFERIVGAGQIHDQAEANGELLDLFYEPVCQKWFIARVIRSLAEQLEYDVYRSQQTLRAIEQISFDEKGDVESFRLVPEAE